jgi:myo-inositol 2-dehydrogenase/D-chiro-inositol 1-dehydrogenase
VGRIGKIHIENIIRFFPDVKIQAICDIQIKQLGNWAKSLGITNVTSDPSTIFRDPNVQAVLICSSTDTHSEFIIQAANAKKHIFCEKPIGNDLAKIRESLDVVKKMGVKLMLGFNRRFDHNFKRIKLTVKSGKIGLPHIIKITSRDPAPPPLEFLKRSGGLFFDMTIHDWDMARFLADDEVEEVYAVGSALIDPRIADFDIDTAVAVLKFKQGTLALIDNSRQAKYGYDQRVEVFGSEGAIIVDNDTPNTAKTFTSNSIESDKIHHFFLERYMQSYKDEMIEFLECLRDDNNPSVTGYDGIQAVLIAEAAKKSLMEHRPVTISEVDTK